MIRLTGAHPCRALEKTPDALGIYTPDLKFKPLNRVSGLEGAGSPWDSEGGRAALASLHKRFAKEMGLAEGAVKSTNQYMRFKLGDAVYDQVSTVTLLIQLLTVKQWLQNKVKKMNASGYDNTITAMMTQLLTGSFRVGYSCAR